MRLDRVTNQQLASISSTDPRDTNGWIIDEVFSWGEQERRDMVGPETLDIVLIWRLEAFPPGNSGMLDTHVYTGDILFYLG